MQSVKGMRWHGRYGRSLSENESQAVESPFLRSTDKGEVRNWSSIEITNYRSQSLGADGPSSVEPRG